jgi:hypothetical protein
MKVIMPSGEKGERDMTRKSMKFAGQSAVLVLALVPLLTLTGAPAVAENELPESFEANVMVVTGQPGGPRSNLLEIRIREWTTEEDRGQLLTEIQEATSQRARNRNRAVARALRGGHTIGSVNLRATTSWPLRFSRQYPLENGGRRILLATDRPVTFQEEITSSVARDFDVTVIELMLDKDGQGEGTLSVGTEVTWNPQTEKLEVTNFSTQAVRLTNVRPRP